MIGFFNFFIWSRDFKEKISKILEELEEGKITYEEAIKLIKNAK